MAGVHCVPKLDERVLQCIEFDKLNILKFGICKVVSCNGTKSVSFTGKTIVRFLKDDIMVYVHYCVSACVLESKQRKAPSASTKQAFCVLCRMFFFNIANYIMCTSDLCNVHLCSNIEEKHWDYVINSTV
jgi:hypothetical protein